MGLSPTLGVDLAPGPGVDHVADFSVPQERFKWTRDKYKTAVLFNVLEHTFDPICILRNTLECVQPGGSILLVVPTVWPLHDYPQDFCRLEPHWFEQFASSHKLKLERKAFCWLSPFGITPVDQLRNGSQYQLPTFQNLGRSQFLRYWRTRIANRLLGTYGRTQFLALCSVGVVMKV